MPLIEKIKNTMLDVYSITNETRTSVQNASSIEELLTIMGTYPQMAQAITFLRVVELLQVKQ